MCKLEQEDGTPADPPTLRTSVPAWQAVDTIPLGRERTLRVTDVQFGSDVDADFVLVIEPPTR